MRNGPAHASTCQVEAAPEANTILLPEFLARRGVRHVDLLKIDVDGPDLLILKTMGPPHTDIEVMAIGIEVNFFGSSGPTENTFHNVDRLLKEWGFELFDLTVRKYPARHLPVQSDFHPYPAESRMGRIRQGDAFYARDICAPHNWDAAEKMSPEGLLKLATVFSIFSLPDCAAEILVSFADRLSNKIDLRHALDLLATQAQPGVAAPASDQDYVQAFEHRAYAHSRKATP